jgi:dolichyl-phosphate-mannose-protein mannosyltransferase
LSLVGLVFGYDPSVCRYDEIHQVYQPASPAAVFGLLLPPVMYLILRQMGVSRFAAILGGCIINLDMLNLMESRLILTDSQLMLYSALSLYVALLFWERLNACLVLPASSGKRNRVSNGTFKMSKQEENAWCIGLGLICGAALSVKWTALATPALIGLESFAGFFVLQKPMPFRMMWKVLAVAFVEYAFYFWVHFALLPYSGDGDAFMPIEFQRTLVNNTAYDVRHCSRVFASS